MIKYEVIIYWSEEDDAFLAEVPELAGCMADGQTYQEALENVEVVIQEWIDTARDLGRPIPEPKGRLPCPSVDPERQRRSDEKRWVPTISAFPIFPIDFTLASRYYYFA